MKQNNNKTVISGTCVMFLGLAILVAVPRTWSQTTVVFSANRNLDFIWQGTNVVLGWGSLVGGSYQVEETDSLVTGSWDSVYQGVATSSSSSFIPDVAPYTKAFWRLLSPEPTVYNLQPSIVSTSGGDALYIIGQDFHEGDEAKIDGVVYATTYIDEHTLMLTAPGLPEGFYNVEIVSGGQSIGQLIESLEVVDAGSVQPLYEPPAPAPGEPRSNTGAPGLILEIPHFSGEFMYRTTDMAIPGRMLDFIWCRTYRSRSGENTAMGNGWTHSYDIRVEDHGFEVTVHDGTGRADPFYFDPDTATFVRNGFFSVGTISNNAFSLQFPDNGQWLFNSFASSNAPGKISQSIDRNGNSMSFIYDSSGRLIEIVDDLGRTNSIAYNGGGYIQSVTDFTGRSVSYEYYGGGDTNGGPGDLKTVISPAVTGTPNGNDFPGGKTNQYTYSTGNADLELNHNLLTMTDGKQQTWLQNTYAATLNPLDTDYDRVESQIIGDAGDRIDYVYVPQVPGPANDYAVMTTIVNDRVGNVSEFSYDAANNLVALREYTGRAVADQPTTISSNRPTAKLRVSDPDYYETIMDWDVNHLLLKTIYPEGNSVEYIRERMLNPSSERRTWANIREMHTLAGPPGGDQAELIELFEYDTTFGCGSCGFNFVTRHVDARGNETLHAYDEKGNRTNTIHRIPSITETWEYNANGQVTAHVLPGNGNGHHRRDEYTYYTTGPQTGYLENSIADAGFENITTTYEYNDRGAVTRIVDPRGGDTQYTRNDLDQIVRVLGPEVATSSGPVRYERLKWYDENNKVVRIDNENRGGDGSLNANAYFTAEYEYDVLNRLVRTTREVDSTNNVITEYEYDGNGNRTLKRLGEAANGTQPANTIATLYDERDLVFRKIRAEGDADQSTTQYEYDGNGNLITEIQGLESGVPRVLLGDYDSYYRMTQRTDPMGNMVHYEYDANGNMVNIRLEGELLDVVGSAGNVRLSEVTYVYDAMDRPVRQDVAFFDPSTQSPEGDGYSTTTLGYNGLSQVLTATNDNGNPLTVSYDTVGRMDSLTDAAGNSRSFTYDDNGNVVQLDETDLSDLGNPTQAFTTTYAYDVLNRLVSTVNNIGSTNGVTYDSRDNVVLRVDALGNEELYEYDGLRRRHSTIRILTDNGNGTGTPVDTITTLQEWDDSSRLISLTDDNGHTTSYTYDALNRLVQRDLADGTSESRVYDVHGNVVQTTDANGSVVDHAYDRLNRLVQNNVLVHGVGISSNTALETYSYDGASRLIGAGDEDSTVVRQYNSLGSLVGETLNGELTYNIRDGVGNLKASIYPGGRPLVYSYTGTERLDTIGDGSTTNADYSYIGNRVEQIDYGNGTLARFTYDGITGIPNVPGDFGVKQVRRSEHLLSGGGGVIEDRRYLWDPVGNKRSRRDVPGAPANRFEHQYVYDSDYRLRRTQVFDGNSTLKRDEQYQLDGEDNRITVTGGDNPGSYFMDPTLPIPADAQVNQYTATSFDDRIYDDSGNLVAIDPGQAGERLLTYDYRNRLVQVVDAAGGQTHEYQYDALGRRTVKIEDVGGAAIETRYFYDDRSRVIEEQDGTGTTIATYVGGQTGEEIISMQRAGMDFYYHADDIGNVMAVSDNSGTVIEKYDYGDYGAVLDAQTLSPFNGNPSAVGNPYFGRGRRYDPETGYYQVGSRSFDPLAGRFTSRANSFVKEWPPSGEDTDDFAADGDVDGPDFDFWWDEMSIWQSPPPWWHPLGLTVVNASSSKSSSGLKGGPAGIVADGPKDVLAFRSTRSRWGITGGGSSGVVSDDPKGVLTFRMTRSRWGITGGGSSGIVADGPKDVLAFRMTRSRWGITGGGSSGVVSDDPKGVLSFRMTRSRWGVTGGSTRIGGKVQSSAVQGWTGSDDIFSGFGPWYADEGVDTDSDSDTSPDDDPGDSDTPADDQGTEGGGDGGGGGGGDTGDDHDRYPPGSCMTCHP